MYKARSIANHESRSTNGLPGLRRSSGVVRYFGVCGLVLVAGVMLASCREDMQDQPKYLPYRGSEIFPDSASSRPLEENTVARGYLREDQALYTGKSGTAAAPIAPTAAAQGAGAQTGASAQPGSASSSAATQPAATGSEVNEFPFPITKQVLDRGQERFNIYCSPCHGVLGDGNGMIANRGFRHPPSYHDDRLRTAPLGHFYDVITNGFGAMPDYRMQIPPHERWAIIAYIRALQYSQNANMADLPPADQAQVK